MMNGERGVAKRRRVPKEKIKIYPSTPLGIDDRVFIVACSAR
jgi:hypothetical protein